MMTERIHFSIIVPVYNSAETLDDCLAALVNQDYPQEDYEIVVVNDGSTDNSAEIASRYPVRLINLETNQGRVIARNAGAKAARFDTLVFNDSRVVPERALLDKVRRRAYQPLIPDVKVYDGSKWGFSRFFYLLRRKIYAPYYPLSSGPDEFWITPENFDQAPKGTGNLVCDRDLWQRSQPKEADKSTNDDTRILSSIVKSRPILRTTRISAEYTQRTSVNSVIKHLFQRGPLFADYYLRPGGRYRALYLVIWLLTVLAIPMIALRPFGAIVGIVLLLLLGLGVSALYLGETVTDIGVVAMCLPVVVITFGAGILRWQVRQVIQRARSWVSA
ncbi:MAG: glycosyltransferase family 2 protein [Anaerolineae bacterium]|nr:glycosyltransferase family 2 protein [Anaerolineae bacterium]